MGTKNLLNGAEDGVPFTTENQPTGEQKRAGWVKKKFTRALIKEMLSGQYKFKSDSPLRAELVETFGEEIVDQMTAGEMLIARQIQKAIKKTDTQAANLLLTQALGNPSQDITSKGEQIAPPMNNEQVMLLLNGMRGIKNNS